MAVLAHHFPMDEGSGLVLNDVVGGAHLTVVPWGEYPIWQGTTGGMRFSGGGFCTGYAYDPNLLGTCNTMMGPYAISCWFNLQGNLDPASFGGRLIFASADFDPYYTCTNFDFRHPFQDFLYIGTGGQAGFAGHYNPHAADRVDGVIGTTVFTGDSDWHHLLGYVYPHIAPDEPWGTVKLYVDGVLEAQQQWDIRRQLTNHAGFMIGCGEPYSFYRPNPPGVGSNSNGTFPGDIRDCRMYCGYLTDEDVLGILNPPTYVGHPQGPTEPCAYTDQKVCLTRSTSRCTGGGNSTTPVIIR